MLHGNDEQGATNSFAANHQAFRTIEQICPGSPKIWFGEYLLLSELLKGHIPTALWDGFTCRNCFFLILEEGSSPTLPHTVLDTTSNKPTLRIQVGIKTF